MLLALGIEVTGGGGERRRLAFSGGVDVETV
jgi:hypothetical protein